MMFDRYLFSDENKAHPAWNHFFDLAKDRNFQFAYEMLDYWWWYKAGWVARKVVQ